MNGHSNKRRYKLIAVNPQDILTLFGKWRFNDYVSLPIIKDLPEGYEVHGVHHSFEHDAFLIAVYHETFPIVPENTPLPIVRDFQFATAIVTQRSANECLRLTSEAEHAKLRMQCFDDFKKYIYGTRSPHVSDRAFIDMLKMKMSETHIIKVKDSPES